MEFIFLLKFFNIILNRRILNIIPLCFVSPPPDLGVIRTGGLRLGIGRWGLLAEIENFTYLRIGQGSTMMCCSSIASINRAERV